jgi:hypothetical protein
MVARGFEPRLFAPQAKVLTTIRRHRSGCFLLSFLPHNYGNTHPAGKWALNGAAVSLLGAAYGGGGGTRSSLFSCRLLTSSNDLQPVMS